MSPAVRGRAVARRVEPLLKAQRLAPSAGHPSRGLATTLRARWRTGCRRNAAVGLAGALANAAIKAAPSSRCRTARSGRRCRQDDDSGQIPAGKFVEVCGKLPAGLRIQCEFETGSAVDFNVHYHAGSAKVSASNLSAVTRARQVFEVTSEQDYCWTWINKAGSNTLLTVTLQR